VDTLRRAGASKPADGTSFGARGTLGLDITTSAGKGLHDVIREWVRSDRRLTHLLLTRMRDENGKVSDAGFYDGRNRNEWNGRARQNLMFACARVAIQNRTTEATRKPLNELLMLPALNVRASSRVTSARTHRTHSDGGAPRSISVSFRQKHRIRESARRASHRSRRATRLCVKLRMPPPDCSTPRS